ncbi:uncharacterized protein [Rutidosis leptorrhynchoides]|uniref:uncharacterized protein n=1 Tax=Rutidosis leptorrhynchoides TaxID=125765 RepID=UPI003A9A5A64
MLEKNKGLLAIPGGEGKMMPLYAAALYGYHDVAKCLYQNSDLHDDGWNPQNRGWVFEKCIENDMFDIAQLMVETHPELATNGDALRSLARKPEELSVRKTTFIKGIIIWVLVFLGLTKGAPEKDNKALALLRTIGKAIAKKPKNEIDNILRGPPDPIKHQNKSDLGWSNHATRLHLLISEYVVKMNVETDNTGLMEDKGNQATRLQNLIFRHLAELHDETHKIIRGGPTSTKQDNMPLTRKEHQAEELKELIFKHIEEIHNETHNIIKNTNQKDELAQKLRDIILKSNKNIRTKANKVIVERTYSSRVLFIAAELGNTNFIVELIRQNPDLIWKVNDENQTIFHVAVKHRHEGIYNLLYEIGSMKDMITPLKDKNGNNMLHLVGMSEKQKLLREGAGLQMQRELAWFREVKQMIPPSYRERKNADDQTPRELFIKEHEDIVKQDEKWMKAIAGQCMVVAALIATMVFTAAYTIPGGYNQNDGIPIFHSKTVYKVFVVADAISLLTSITSILYIFISVYFSSNYTEIDFSESLPEKLIVGLLYLSISIISMLIAFSVSFFILYQNGTLWMPILISVFALIPLYLSFKMYIILFYAVILITYDSRNLFRPKKPVVYYKNPTI